MRLQQFVNVLVGSLFFVQGERMKVDMLICWCRVGRYFINKMSKRTLS